MGSPTFPPRPPLSPPPPPGFLKMLGAPEGGVATAVRPGAPCATAEGVVGGPGGALLASAGLASAGGEGGAGGAALGCGAGSGAGAAGDGVGAGVGGAGVLAGGSGSRGAALATSFG